MTHTLRRFILLCSLFLLTAFLGACGGGGNDSEGTSDKTPSAAAPATPATPTLSSSKAIASFSIAEASAVMTGQRLQVTVPHGTDLRRLVATFAATGGSVTVNGEAQVSGVTVRDFSQPVTYVVTAADGSAATYVVTVVEAPSSSKAITTFSIGGVVGTVREREIAVTLPNGTDPKRLVATFSTTGASVTVDGTPQSSGTTAQDFSGPVTYTVTAADGSTGKYVVFVTIAPSEAKALTAFSIAGVNGTMRGANIDLVLPFGMDRGHQIASFTSTGASVSVRGAAQSSGATVQDFSAPVPYVVTAADGSTATFTVTVTSAPSPAKSITAFSVGGVQATVSDHAIHATLPAGSDPAVQVAVFTSTGASVSVDGVDQVSGGLPRDFRRPVAYVVHAADGSTATYTVTVDVAKSSAKAITSFMADDKAGQIAENGPGKFTIAVPLFFRSDLNYPLVVGNSGIYRRTVTFATTGVKVTVDGVVQKSGTVVDFYRGLGTPPLEPIVYVVTAEDGSTASYTIAPYTLSIAVLAPN